MQSFDDLAASYDRIGSLVPPPFVEFIRAQLPARGARALDAGCGSGHFAAMLAERYDLVVGIDISGPMIEIARRMRSRPNIEYRVEDLMAFDDARGFDLVLSTCVLHHVPNLEVALQRLRGLVRAGGVAVLIDNISWTTTPPRWVHTLSAWRHLPLDVMAHGWRDARWLFEFRTNGRWLDHLATDRYLSRTEFRRRYGAVFPGAAFRSFGWAESLTWRAAS